MAHKRNMKNLISRIFSYSKLKSENRELKDKVLYLTHRLIQIEKIKER